MVQRYAVDAVGERCKGIIIAGRFANDLKSRLGIVGDEVGSGRELAIFGLADCLPLPCLPCNERAVSYLEREQVVTPNDECD